LKMAVTLETRGAISFSSTSLMPAGAGCGCWIVSRSTTIEAVLQSQLGRERQRIGLQWQQVTIRPDNLIFVFVAGAGFGHEFPKSRCRARAWRGGVHPID
jgi:hypothetical protein